MTRQEAESLYVGLILYDGNPSYFIYKYLETIDDDELKDELVDLGEEVEIEEEEEDD